MTATLANKMCLTQQTERKRIKHRTYEPVTMTRALALLIRAVGDMMFVKLITSSERLCALGACVIANTVVHLFLVTLQAVLVPKRLRALIARE
jgi:hypothetical protein